MKSLLIFTVGYLMGLATVGPLMKAMFGEEWKQLLEEYGLTITTHG